MKFIARSFLLCPILLGVIILFASNSLAQWTQIQGVNFGGRQTHGGSIVFRDGVLWAGKMGISKSTDLGKTWIQLSLPTAGQIYDICAYDKNTCLVSLKSSNGSVFLTRNGGASWTLINTSTSCYCAAFWGSPNNIVVLNAFPGEGFFSQDGGASWRHVNFEKWTQRFDVLPDGSAVVLAGGKLYRSVDGGTTWAAPSGSMAQRDCWSMARDSCDGSNTIYICNEAFYAEDADNDTESEIFVTTDLGVTFTQLFHASKPNLAGSIITTPNAVFVQKMSGANGSGVWRSTDHGKNWSTIGGPVSYCDSRTICAIDDNNLFAIGDDGSLWQTNNCGGDPVISDVDPDTTLSFSFSSGTIINDTSGSIVRLPVYLQHSGKMPSIDMTVHYPAGPLQYLGAFLHYGKSVDVSGSRWPGRARLRIEAEDLLTLSDSLVGYVAFRWSPLEFDCATIIFDSIDFLRQNFGCSPHHTIYDSAFKGIIGAYKWCDPTADVRSVRATKARCSIFPNPNNGSFSLETTVDLGQSTIEVYDELGKLCLIFSQTLLKDTPVPLSISSLANGAYHVLIRSTTFREILYLSKSE